MIVLLEIVISIFLRWTWREWASGPSVDSSPNGVKRMPQLFESVIIYKNGSLNTKHDIFSGSLPHIWPILILLFAPESATAWELFTGSSPARLDWGENEKGEINDVCSFYNLPSTVLGRACILGHEDGFWAENRSEQPGWPWQDPKLCWSEKCQAWITVYCKRISCAIYKVAPRSEPGITFVDECGGYTGSLSQNRPSWWAHWHSIFDSHWSFWFYPIFCWFLSNFCLKFKTSSWAIFLRFAGHEKHNQLRAAYSYWNVANTVPLQAAGWADFLEVFQRWILDRLGSHGVAGIDVWCTDSGEAACDELSTRMGQTSTIMEDRERKKIASRG